MVMRIPPINEPQSEATFVVEKTPFPEVVGSHEIGAKEYLVLYSNLEEHNASTKGCQMTRSHTVPIICPEPAFVGFGSVKYENERNEISEMT